MTLRAALFSSIRDVPKEQWNALATGHSHTFSYGFWEILEKSALTNFVYTYILLYDKNDTAVAAATIYTVSTDVAIFASKWLRIILWHIRKFIPNFLLLRMIECGTPVILNSPPFISNGSVPTREVLAAIHQVMYTKARKEGQLLLVIRDFEPNAVDMRPDCEALGYCWVDSLPNTYLDVKWKTWDDYLAAMKSYYRAKVIKHFKRAKNQNFRHELVDDFVSHADMLCNQWMVVHMQADEFQREVLTPEFYRQYSSMLGAASKTLFFYQGDALIGHALLLLDGDMLRWLYFGRTHATNDSLYLYVGHSVIETAILLGVKRVEMGLTTYAIKQDMGAQIAPIKLAVRASRDFLNPLVRLFYPLLNHIPKIENKEVFKQ